MKAQYFRVKLEIRDFNEWVHLDIVGNILFYQSFHREIGVSEASVEDKFDTDSTIFALMKIIN